MKRQIDYRRRLPELMAARGLHSSTDLSPLLKERGIEISASQVYRLVTQRPERISQMMVAALCDIFTCGPEDLITVTAADAKVRKIASDANVVDLNQTIRSENSRLRWD